MPPEGRGHSSGSMKGGLGTDTLGHKSVIEKLKSAIEKLKIQNEQLKHDLVLENKFSVRPSDPYAQALINRLQDEGDFLARKIVMDMRKKGMLEQQLGETSSTLGTTRNLMGGINAAKEKSVAAQKKIKLLENRLEKAYVKYNQSVSHNKQLREQINNLRQERIMFEGISSNLEREVQKLKKDMAETIQLANTAFEAKEKALSEMNSVKVAADKEQERVRAKELAAREKETQELLRMGTLSAEKKKTKTMTGKGATYNKALAQNVAAEKVQLYGQAFEKIQQATGIDEIDQLVNTFITAEDHNYTLFNYVNEVNQEIEKLEDQITAIRQEITQYKESGIELDQSKGAQSRDVAEHLTNAELQAELYEKRYEAASSTVNLLKTSIWDLFTKIGCDTCAVRELLGEDGVTEANIMSYLGIIEQRTNELLMAFALRKSAEGGDSISNGLLAHPLTQASSRFVIEPPSTTVEEEIEGLEQEPMDDEKPMTRENLETRVQKTLPHKLDTAIKIRPPGDTGGRNKSPVRR
eukprot:gene15696-21805_t